MMDREYQEVIVGGPSHHVHSPERSLQEIKRQPERFLHQFLECSRLNLGRREFTVPQHSFVVSPDHLQDPLFAGQEGAAHDLLPVSNPLDGQLGFPKSDPALYFDESANMVSGISHRYWRGLPQLALGKGYRMEAGFPALQPLP